MINDNFIIIKSNYIFDIYKIFTIPSASTWLVVSLDSGALPKLGYTHYIRNSTILFK